VNHRDTLNTLLRNVAKVAGPGAPFVELARQVVEVILELAQAGKTVAEIRRRLADGIQAGDIVSDEALEDARKASAAVDSYLEELEP